MFIFTYFVLYPIVFANYALSSKDVVLTSYGFLQKPLVPASLNEVTMGTILAQNWKKLGPCRRRNRLICIMEIKTK